MNSNICICDFHSHILPCVDDGAKDFSTAMTLLNMEIEQGVKHLCFTPHFYSTESVDSFIEKRNNAFNEFKEEITKQIIVNVPDMYLGAEIALNYATAEIPDLDKLCITGTNLILLELPDGFWGDWILETLYKISAVKSLTPIIAHADRYIDNNNAVNILNSLIDMDIILQFNSYNLTNLKVRNLIKKILSKNTTAPLIGSDAHNPKFRAVTMKKTQSFLFKIMYDKELTNYINSFSMDILKK